MTLLNRFNFEVFLTCATCIRYSQKREKCILQMYNIIIYINYFAKSEKFVLFLLFKIIFSFESDLVIKSNYRLLPLELLDPHLNFTAILSDCCVKSRLRGFCFLQIQPRHLLDC